jgi:hypothetical protein
MSRSARRPDRPGFKACAARKGLRKYMLQQVGRCNAYELYAYNPEALESIRTLRRKAGPYFVELAGLE